MFRGKFRHLTCLSMLSLSLEVLDGHGQVMGDTSGPVCGCLFFQVSVQVHDQETYVNNQSPLQELEC